VHATLIESYIAGHTQFGTPMTGAQKERFYAEYRGLGRLVGVRDRDLPDTYPGFRAYFESTTRDTLARTRSVDRVLRSVRGAAKPPALPLPDALWRALRLPAERALWTGGIGLVPRHLRERFGITWSRSDELTFQALGSISRALGPAMPRRLKIMGPGQLRLRRRAIARGPLGRGADLPATRRAA
jgi:uncharacterized protein (DUF2236 family)